MDLALDLDPNSPTYNDLKFTASRDLVTVDRAAGIKQDILTAIRVYLGEWFLDTSVGVPYYQTVFVKNPDQALVNAAFLGAIATVPGVTAVKSLTVTQDAPNRAPTLAFTVETLSGTVDYSNFLTG